MIVQNNIHPELMDCMVYVLTFVFSFITIIHTVSNDRVCAEVLSNHLQNSRIGNPPVVDNWIELFTSVQARGVVAACQNVRKLMHDLARDLNCSCV